MIANPLKPLVAELSKQLRTTTFNLEDIRRRQQEMENIEIEAEEAEPGQPEIM